MKPSVRAAVFARDGRKCVLCGYEGQHLAIDHIHPQARGGTDDLDNLRVLCRACNSHKAGYDRFAEKIEREEPWLQQVQLRLPDDLAAAIDERAERVGLSRHAWLIKALSWALEQPTRTVTVTKKEQL